MYLCLQLQVLLQYEFLEVLLLSQARVHVLRSRPPDGLTWCPLEKGAGVDKTLGLRAAGGVLSASPPKREARPRRPTSGGGVGAGAVQPTREAQRVARRDAVCQPAYRADHGAHRRECQVHHREYGPGVRLLREEAGGSREPRAPA